MLKEISISNFAIIDSLSLSFTKGFNVFTGETGAGKSIILDAVSAVLGGKTDTAFVREGSERASIEAVFTTDQHQNEIKAILEREDVLNDSEDDGSEVVLTREIRNTGRSSSRVNGHSVNADLLKEIGAWLVDIHGQSDHLSLLRTESHIRLLDRFAGNQDLLHEYRILYKELLSVRKELKDLKLDEEERYRRQDMLQFQVNEIEEASLSEDEETKLTAEADRLANYEIIGKNVRSCILNLEGNQEEIPGLIDLMGSLNHSINNLLKYDNSFNKLCENCISLSDQINDMDDFLQHYQEKLEFDPKRQEEIEERLMTINNLKRKYGGSVQAILEFGDNAKTQLQKLVNSSEEIENLTAKEKNLKDQLSDLARQLSANRKKAAAEISQKVERELDDLRMSRAEFKVDIRSVLNENGLKNSEGQNLAFTDTGFDQVEFLIAPNPGEGFSPLTKIASGGETSRLMLALKNTLAQADTISTMIFDEIDQGIGGRIGAVVGQKLWQLSEEHQVLCITHLPQLAAYYDTHFHVRKIISDNRTHTTVERLDENVSLHEIAALLGGDTEENLAAARAMRLEACDFKKMNLIDKKSENQKMI